MSFLKGTVIFLAGGFTTMALLAKAFNDATESEEKVEFENDEIKVSRVNNNRKDVSIAVITYKEKTENSETEETTEES